MIKTILKILGCVLSVLVLALVGLIVFLTATEYRPADIQVADRVVLGKTERMIGSKVTVYSWNIGYAGLGKESDFFMDGGSMVNPPDQETVEKNLLGIESFIQNTPADAWLLQEVDVNSARTGALNEFERLQKNAASAAFVYNYKCSFVPIPLPPMGRIESGLATLCRTQMHGSAERVSLPCPFAWPVRAANIKRCLLVTRLPVENSDKELVLVNLHLEAYESGEGRIAQTRRLLEIMNDEYMRGNYVIAGGDFNQSFPGVLERYPVADPAKWTPGILENDILPSGWQFAYDEAVPTCRLLDQPYSPDCQLYVIDGFILSPNVQLNEVQTIDLQFEHSDHNPVRLSVSLLL